MTSSTEAREREGTGLLWAKGFKLNSKYFRHSPECLFLLFNESIEFIKTFHEVISISTDYWDAASSCFYAVLHLRRCR